MTVWLIRAGKSGEYEQKFIKDKRVYLTWNDLQHNLSVVPSRSELNSKLTQQYPEIKSKGIKSWEGQIWAFVNEIKNGDWVILPLKSQPAIQIGEITGGYQCDLEAENPYFHWRSVKWIGESIPRHNFGQDLLYSFGAFLTICKIQRNNAEIRIIAMRENGWKAETLNSAVLASKELIDGEDVGQSDLEVLALDQISNIISARFKGHRLTVLVEAILKAQGYTTYRSQEGSDGGADILAGMGPLGFGGPRLCVEVKSGDLPIDRPAVDKLLGAVTKFGASEGLFVSWSGYKSTVQKELAPSFFRVRLWSQKELLESLFVNYDKLDEEIKVELPLKRIWTVTLNDE